MKSPPHEGGEEAMGESDLPSLWETKKDADILLTMGASKWELHDKMVRGKSGLIDHILEMVQMKEGMRKIPLKERMFPHSALNTVLKYFYLGESLITEKTEVIDLLSLYEVSATLGILCYVEAGTQSDIPLPHTPKKSIPSATGNDDQHPCSVDETTPRPRKRESMVKLGTEFISRLDEAKRSSQSIPGPANKSGTAENPNPTSKDARVNQIPQDFKFDFQAKSPEAESISTGINQSQVSSLSATPRVITANGAVPNVRSQSSSSSHASTQWESCSEGGERTVPATEMSKSIATSASVELSSHIGVAPESQSQNEKTQTSSGNKKGTNLGNSSLNFSSHIQGGRLPISPPEDSVARQTKETAVPAIYERSSPSYAFNSDSLPRGFHFSGGPQPEQSNISSSKASPSHAQGKTTAVTGVVERERREYVLRGSDVSQTEVTSAPVIPERSSRSYAFHSASLPRSFQFAGGAQGEHSKEPSVKASSSQTPNTKASNSYAQQSTSSSSHTRVKPSPWKADKATAKQIRKGRLIVEPPGESPKPFNFWWPSSHLHHRNLLQLTNKLQSRRGRFGEMLQTVLKLTDLPKLIREISDAASCEFSAGTQHPKILYEYWMSERNAGRGCIRGQRHPTRVYWYKY
ncbi:hypothetical protein CNYM01_01797 [Colletotrichum nymphaeae SA-01]|uniref:BTB domain-containing protein n=1 Tax=Colletotrichum nymphaeae SA-01 TaxID=1460502 RepID=A0A135RQF2_9PEZI|nr:hypothetical protein CNYM01_01797 [Colletotrichum nymphaeae SA-01]